MSGTIPIFVINLDRAPERWTFVRQQFQDTGLGDRVRRFSAVDAKADGFQAPGYAPHSWRDRWELETSEQAVFESHLAIWRKVAAEYPQGAVICEDDILVSGEFRNVIKILDGVLDGIVKLDGFSARRRYGAVREMGGLIVRPILEAVPSGACYALAQGAAIALIEAAERYCETLDDFVFSPARNGNAVQLFPAVAVQGICCDPDPARAIPGAITQSEREGPAKLRKAAKGPFPFRLRKELLRLSHRLRVAAGNDRRLLANGGLIACPELADDLPPYRT